MKQNCVPRGDGPAAGSLSFASEVHSDAGGLQGWVYDADAGDASAALLAREGRAPAPGVPSALGVGSRVDDLTSSRSHRPLRALAGSHQPPV